MNPSLFHTPLAAATEILDDQGNPENPAWRELRAIMLGTDSVDATGILGGEDTLGNYNGLERVPLLNVEPQSIDPRYTWFAANDVPIYSITETPGEASTSWVYYDPNLCFQQEAEPSPPPSPSSSAVSSQPSWHSEYQPQENLVNIEPETLIDCPYIAPWAPGGYPLYPMTDAPGDASTSWVPYNQILPPRQDAEQFRAQTPPASPTLSAVSSQVSWDSENYQPTVASPRSPYQNSGHARAPSVSCQPRKKGQKSHQRKCIRTGNGSFACPFPHCTQTLTRRFDLPRHLRRHTMERPYACICGRAFARTDALRRHQRDSKTGFHATVPSPI